tara:strand:+ start:264 stop:494 length:231 start_codon:yes stop_codon:yes gene_type:complete
MAARKAKSSKCATKPARRPDGARLPANKTTRKTKTRKRKGTSTRAAVIKRSLERGEYSSNEHLGEAIGKLIDEEEL